MRSAASSWASKNAPRRPSYASVDVAEITVKVHRAAMLRKMQARTVADLRVSVEEGVLTVVVRDFGAGGQVVAPVGGEDPLVVFGRGLMLVEAMTDRWGSEHDPGGTTVWFSIDLAPHDVA